MAPSIIIELAQGLTLEARTALRSYLSDQFRLSDTEWQQVRSAINLLARSTVTFSGRRYTFKQFYGVFINGTYARPFLQQLATAVDPERAGPPLQAETARKIFAWLQLNDLAPSIVSGAEYLIIYCLYQWASFARGYLFERTVIQDLTTAGIVLTAHAPERGQERYTPSDLSIPGLGAGDIKTSLYFLENLAAPQADFYITRLYDAEGRTVRQVVLMTPKAWHQIDGEPEPAAMGQAARHFPLPVLVEAASTPWVVVDYAVWKDRVLRWQSRRRSR